MGRVYTKVRGMGRREQVVGLLIDASFFTNSHQAPTMGLAVW